MNYLTVPVSRLLVLFGIMLMTNSCEKALVDGCTDPKSLNYNPLATKDDGSCQYSSLANTNCAVNNTGQVYFINHSYQDSTLDVYWDSTYIATVVPGDTSKTFTFTAGVPHGMYLKYTKSQMVQYNTQYYYLDQCGTDEIYLY